MGELQRGMLVQHATLGLGKIIALESDAVHVFFTKADSRFATKLRLPMALPLLSPAGGGVGASIAKLSAFALDVKTGRYGLSEVWLSHDQAVARFLDVFPDGFRDARYVGEGDERLERPARWRRAQAAWTEAFGDGKGQRLLAGGEVGEAVSRALAVERHVRTLQNTAEKATLAAALAKPAPARAYLVALFELLSAPEPGQEAFEKLASMVAGLPGASEPEARWELVTALPFLAAPDRHMLVRPRLTCDSAHRLGMELRFEPEPSWASYAALLDGAGQLLARLRPLGARDFIDVETFMHTATTRRTVAKVATAKLATAKLAT